MEGGTLETKEQKEDSEALQRLINLEISTNVKSVYEVIKDVAYFSAVTKPNRNTDLQTYKKQQYSIDSYAKSKAHPECNMDDYYCKICKAHMNSQDMWESHISGKRHLKNVKKEREAPHPPRQEKDNEDLWDKRSYSSSSEATSRQVHSRRRSRSQSYRSHHSPSSRKKVCTSPVDGKWRHDRFYLLEQSPPRPHHSSHSSSTGLQVLVQNFNRSDKVKIIEKLSGDIFVVTENAAEKVKNVIMSLLEEYLQARVKELPRPVQNKLLYEGLKQLEDQEIDTLLPDLKRIFEDI